MRDEVQRVCAAVGLALGGVEVASIRSKDRHGDSALARQVSQYVLRMRLRWSYPVIGREFNRDHTSVMNAVKRVRALVDQGDHLTRNAVAAGEAALARALGNGPAVRLAELRRRETALLEHQKAVAAELELLKVEMSETVITHQETVMAELDALKSEVRLLEVGEAIEQHPRAAPGPGVVNVNGRPYLDVGTG
jgi:hypothetical protein